jgi:pyridoxine kinase
VLTGYVATREQATLAAEAIDRVRTTLRQGPTPLVLVDPIMGDEGVGLYVPEEVASAQAMLLVPRADLAACNLWEFQQLVGTQDASTPEQIAALARGTGRDWLITSVSTDHGVGALLVDGAGARLALAQRVAGRLPRGTGDLLKLRFVGGLLAGEDRTLALQRSVGLVAAVLERAAAMQSAELPLISCRDLLADAPGGWLQPVAC